MGIAFRVLWAACKNYYEEMFRLVGANLLWLLLLIPIVTFPPATAGMLYLTNQIAHKKSVELGLFWEGFRKYFVKSWLLTLLNVAVAIIFYVNLHFYAQFPAQWAMVVRGLFVGLAVLWCLIQLYVFPMLFEQHDPRLLLALRNAAFLTFASPVTSLVLGVLLVVVAVLSIGLTLPFAVAMMAVIGLVVNEAVLTLLVRFGIRKPPEELAEG